MCRYTTEYRVCRTYSRFRFVRSQRLESSRRKLIALLEECQKRTSIIKGLQVDRQRQASHQLESGHPSFFPSKGLLRGGGRLRSGLRLFILVNGDSTGHLGAVDRWECCPGVETRPWRLLFAFSTKEEDNCGLCTTGPLKQRRNVSVLVQRGRPNLALGSPCLKIGNSSQRPEDDNLAAVRSGQHMRAR